MNRFDELYEAGKYQELKKYYESEAYEESLENISEQEAFMNDFRINALKRGGFFLTTPPAGADYPYEI